MEQDAYPPQIFKTPQTFKKYRSKPVLITAIQLRWSNWNAVCEFVGDTINPQNGGFHIEDDQVSDTCGEEGPYIGIKVTTTHGETAVVRHGDWIIPDTKPGTFYPCKPDVFARRWEEVPDLKDVTTIHSPEGSNL